MADDVASGADSLARRVARQLDARLAAYVGDPVGVTYAALVPHLADPCNWNVHKSGERRGAVRPAGSLRLPHPLYSVTLRSGLRGGLAAVFDSRIDYALGAEEVEALARMLRGAGFRAEVRFHCDADAQGVVLDVQLPE